MKHKSSPAASASLLDQIDITPEEREFGWNGSLSGVRGLSEQQARRILHFENSLRQRLEIDRTEDHERDATSGNEFGKLTSGTTNEPLEVVAARHCRATCTRNPFSPCILKPRASLPEYQRLASSRLNRSLRISSSQSSFLRFKSIKRSKSEESSWSSESDEFSYLIAREKIGNSDQTSLSDSYTRSPGSGANLERSHTKTGLRGIIRKLGGALSLNTSRCHRKAHPDDKFPEDGSYLCHLSHDMVGSASPFPMRPPLYLGSNHPSTSLNGEWIGVSRKVVSESNRQ
ncbi:uncharacterized protein PGTG_06442 [Puccinia graminis f. sp. tritici CRL 75-36-700-3]|uniref:Uncharacterized protein n=1 Tax=Puccinia graminis f. sp. tritici (strain CRL 75-36-700-3 / race SCCL) TaxID=418459 RepID=E3K7J5_PUCGT|nr:uncharacterized protein PGTG_06442 [Puccinia graminis f. sp. tritici CRL 75-36-700-3]EFP80486.1 hypothetical protein PGTG_06442 [Puccinia graminis f. sp. tritici CRL 75-36-700-3]